LVIEDDLEIVLSAAKEGIPSFLMSWRWNQNGNLPSNVQRVGNYSEPGSQWRDIIKIVKNERQLK